VVTRQRTGFRDTFAVREFRVLWLAQAQSRAGDQLARVGLALLVYDRTSSAALTALVYALTYLPPLIAAPVLTGLADRYPRRTVLVAVDLVRALLVGLMALPGLPLPAVTALLVLLTCPQPLASAARNAVLPAMLPGDRFPAAMGILNTTDYLAQIAGFATGGVLVALLGGPNASLALDAATFLLSATLIGAGLRPYRPAPAPAPAPDGPRPVCHGPACHGSGLLAGIAVLAGDRRLAGLAGLVWLFGFFVVPEALAAPYAHQLHAGPATVGVLMAADLAGAVVGVLLVVRLPPATRHRLLVPLAVATGLPLVATVAAPPLPLTLALWALSGACGGYQTLAQVRFARAIPDAVRARAIGVASAGPPDRPGRRHPGRRHARGTAAGLDGHRPVRRGGHARRGADRLALPPPNGTTRRGGHREQGQLTASTRHTVPDHHPLTRHP
jgi:hypothetical protein